MSENKPEDRLLDRQGECSECGATGVITYRGYCYKCEAKLEEAAYAGYMERIHEPPEKEASR